MLSGKDILDFRKNWSVFACALKSLALKPLGQKVGEQARLRGWHSTWGKHGMNRYPRPLEVFHNYFQRTAIEVMAYLPVRPVSDTETMAGRRLRGRGVIGAEAAAYPNASEATANAKSPCFGFALVGTAQNATMMGQIVGMVRAAMAGKIFR